MPSHSLHSLPVRFPAARRSAAFTLVEVIIAMSIFSVAALGFSATYSRMNQWATQARCSSVADAILRAKIAKVLTVSWIAQTKPKDCEVSTSEVAAMMDPADPYDVGATEVDGVTVNSFPLIPTSNAPVMGSLYRKTTVFESAAGTVLIEYRLSYVFRGKTYNNYASTIRARDE